MSLFKANLSTCSTCGHQWPTGQHGGHSCAEVLKAENDRLREQVIEISRARVEAIDVPRGSVVFFETQGRLSPSTCERMSETVRRAFPEDMNIRCVVTEDGVQIAAVLRMQQSTDGGQSK